jgi:arylsulfatase A-like enzyme
MVLCVNGYKLSDNTGIKAVLWMSDWFYGYKDYWNSKAASLIFQPNILPYYPPDLLLDSARQVLKDINHTEPMFLWTHILVPHSPYLTTEPIKGTFRGNNNEFQDYRSQSQFLGKSYSADQQPYIDSLRLYYDENILYADDAVGRYLQFLKQSGRFDDSIIIISADHGESFRHGYQGHAGPLLYQPLVHIPLLIHLPGKVNGLNGRRIAAYVSQTDVAPTILDLVGYRLPDWIEGRSLKDALGGKRLVDKPVFTMDLEGNPTQGNLVKGHAAVVYGGYKYILTGELYNLVDDPEENINLAELEPEKVKVMSKILQDRFSQSQK